jgi:hypothetical protein
MPLADFLALMHWSTFKVQRLSARLFATWWHGKSPTGCLPFGSLLTKVRRQSSIRHRLVAGRPAAASAAFGIMASKKIQARLASFKVTLNIQRAAGHCTTSKSRHNGQNMAHKGAALKFTAQIHGKAKLVSSRFHSAPRPNWSFNADVSCCARAAG